MSTNTTSTKLTSALLKQRIVDDAIAQIDMIVRQFCGPDDTRDNILKAVRSTKNWKRIEKEKLPSGVAAYHGYVTGTVRRIFDCNPLDDQLRAYVYTDATDTQVLEIRISAE